MGLEGDGCGEPEASATKRRRLRRSGGVCDEPEEPEAVLLGVLTANLLCACLVAGLAIFVTLRRPPPALWPALPLFLVFALLYVLGDAITLVSRDLVSEQVGIAVLYSGSLPAAAACWILAVRYAETQGPAFRHIGNLALRGPLALAALGGLVALTNPWHGQLVTPVIGGPNEPHWMWWLFVPSGYGLVAAAFFLYAATARHTQDRRIRRNALTIAGGILLALGFSSVAHVPAVRTPFDVRAIGLGATIGLLLFGAYRTRMFSRLPVALAEVVRHERDGLVLVDREGFWLYSNPVASGLLGVDLQKFDADVLALMRRLLRDESGAELRESELLRLVQSPYQDSASLVAAGPGGTWLRVTATPLPARRGRVSSVALRIQDVSQERIAEEQLRWARDQLEERVSERTAELESAVEWLRNEIQARQAAEQSLRRSEDRYRAVSELSSDLGFAYHVDADGTLHWDWTTRAVSDATGYKKSELVDRDLAALVHPDDRQRVADQVARGLRGEPVSFEYRMQTKTGEFMWLELQTVSVHDESDESIRVVGAVRNVSERRRSEEERRRLEKRVEDAQRMESLGALAGGIAHDFNNLLAVILGSAALAETELDAPERLAHRLSRIRSAADFGAKLTQQLLSYAGGSPASVEPLDLGQLALEMLDLLRASVPSKCSVEVDVPEQLPLIEGDATQLRQVIVNLVVNAGEALGEGGGEVNLRIGRVRAESDGEGDAADSREQQAASLLEYLFLEVEDDGPGMDDATRRRVFEPFFSTKQTGRGLGLAAVHGIVRRHRGEIELVTAPGQGTRFRVILPRAASSDSGSVAAAAARSGPPARQATVLVVDDDEAVLELATEFLKRAGFRTIVAGGGADAIRLFEERADEIDAVVLDWVMPGVNGEEVLGALRRLRPDVRVVLVTGYRAASTRRASDSAEPSPSYLHKPFAADELVDCVRALLD